MSKQKTKCVFNPDWLAEDKYKQWLAPVEKDRHQAFCVLCMKTFDIGSMGKSALSSHMKGDKHAGRARSIGIDSEGQAPRPINRLDTFFRSSGRGTSATSSATVTATGSGMTGAAGNVRLNRDIASFCAAEDVQNAEILWCLKTVTSHHSFHGLVNSDSLFQKMFPDSEIAKKYQLSETKGRYMAVFGLGPYFYQSMLKKVQERGPFTLLFDESLNHKTQTKQMDVLVRFWEAGQVKSRYLTSTFMGHGTAVDMEKHFYSASKGLDLNKLIQLSMDGPSVNWKFFDSLQQQLDRDLGVQLLNVGSCGLHVLHGAFRTGADASEFGVDDLLSSLYYLFHDSPARREDLTKVTGCIEFPPKYCKHRWVENVPVLERALKLLPHIQVYLQQVKEKKLPKPTCRSFETIQSHAKDVLLEAKLAFYLVVAKDLNEFLTVYQTDMPMIPFLSDDVQKIVKDLMERFVKPEVIQSAKNIQGLLKIDVSDKKNQLEIGKMNLGNKAKSVIDNVAKKKACSEGTIYDFKQKCRLFLVKTVQKIMERSPLKYSLARNMGCLDPRQMAETELVKREKCKTKFHRVCELVVSSKRLSIDDVDKLEKQYKTFLEDVVTRHLSEFRDFRTVTDRVDELLSKYMSSNPDFKELWGIVEKLLLVSHGQATVERGFSINKSVEKDNLSEHSHVAIRAICDYVNHVGGVVNVKVDKELRSAASSGRLKYNAYLAERKKDEEKAKVSLKRRKLEEEIDELKKKKQCLETDIKELYSEADQKALKAEATRNFTFITKSNSLRHTAKEKTKSLEEVVQKLESKMQEVKNH